MRILHLIPTITGGGSQRQLTYLARELRRRGHDVLIAYMNEGSAPGRFDGLPLRRLAARRHRDPRLFFGLAGLIRSWRPDVLQTWYVECDIVGGIVARLTGTPWVMREPSAPPLYTGRIKTWLRRTVARLGRAAIVAHTPAGAAYWSARLVTKCVPVAEIDAAPRADLGASPAIVYAGRLEAMKNVDVAIDAVARLGDVALIVCGDGPRRRDLERIAGPRVRFAGFVPEVWPVIKGADLLVSLSDFEGGPDCVLEAFAAGTPAVLSDIAGHRAIAGDDCAFFVPPCDAAATAAAIRRALADRAEAARRAQNARKRVDEMTVEKMTDAYEELYSQLATRN